MNTKKQFISTVILSFWLGLLLAMPPYYDRKPTPDLTNRAACARPTQQRNLDINNVRAKLWNGGDMWWEHGGGPAAYIIPKAGINGRFVSSLFAGGIWVGGYDDNDNPYIAATTYGNGNATGGDWYAGPLSPTSRSTTSAICNDWNKMFDVKGADIELLKTEYYDNANTNLCGSSNPAIAAALEGLKRWPGRGNAEFSNYYGFSVPAQEMAPFFDRAGDDVYDPCDGDFPKINIRGCEDNGNFRKAQYGDQMLWWVYNDDGAGAAHLETKGKRMNMEVQVQAFSYNSDDALNDMTFYRYKLLNRAAFNMKETYMSLWSDPDLGCSVDDYIGCINDVTKTRSRVEHGITIQDTVTRSMGFVYNGDNDDNINCPNNGGQGYGAQIPILGVDYFRGPNEKTDTIGTDGVRFSYLKELGMTSFSYYRQGGDPQQGDPNDAPQYFNYMSGLWRDGSPYYPCGNGATPCATPGTTRFVFPGHPDRPDEWSMAQENGGAGIAFGDYRFLHTTGPFKMESGATNEIISGVPWVPNQVYPKPNLNQIIAADDLAQGIFDNCFDILDGPDAPELTILENDKSLVITLKAIGNNIVTTAVQDGAATVLRKTGEAYQEVSPAIPSNYPIDKRTYKFEGYRIYQLLSGEVNFNESKDDPTKVREIFTVDLKNGVKKLINWELDPEVPGLFVRKTQIVANDGGIKHSFEFKRDQFANSAGNALVNHKKYYFKAVSYAYNNYKDFLPFEPNNADRGQKSMYIAGRRGVDATYIGVPRRTVGESLGQTTVANYGDIPEIIRADGKGNDGLFLDLDKYTLSDTSSNIIQQGRIAGELGYKRGFGPVEIKVVDPLTVKGGNYILTLSRDSTGRTTIPNPANISKTYWELKQTVGTTTRRWVSERDLVFNTDQYIPDLGISVRVAQPLLAAEDREGSNGFIGASIAYADTTKSWFAGVKDEEQRYGGSRILEIISTGLGQGDKALDPNRVYNGVLNGWVMPYPLCDCKSPAPQLATPAWQAPFPFCDASLSAIRSNTPSTTLDNLNNVDIVYTSDKSKWSRCIVVETTPSSYQTDPDNPFKTIGSPGVPATLGTKGGVPMMGLRADSSVNKEGKVDGTGTGFGWFPGYAVDVETGKRLNIFFGEATHYRGIKDAFGNFIVNGGTGGNVTTGGDMLFNPSTAWIHGDRGPVFQPISALFQAAFGGFHNMYVTKEEYDGCAVLGGSTSGLRGNPSNAKKAKALAKITWTSIVLPTTEMLPIEKGLIPTETTIKLRVNSQYAKAKGTESNQSQPQYRFNLDKFVPLAADENQAATVLDEVKVVPNPYYSYSEDELNENDSRVKIANLPPECTVTIYSLDGRFIRQFKRNEDKIQPNTRSIIPSLDWDLKNGKGIPVASGVYLIHISAPGIGDRVIKWFGVNRALDASRL